MQHQEEEEEDKKVAHDAANTAAVATNDVTVTTTTATTTAAAPTTRQDATEANGNRRHVEDAHFTPVTVNGNMERNSKKQRVSESTLSSPAASAVPAVIDLCSPTLERKPPPAPQQQHQQQNGASSNDTTKNDLTQVAKSRGLSKWAARLLEPNRPRSLIETPQEIPLNDEFLKAFGQREKEHDKAMGRDAL